MIINDNYAHFKNERQEFFSGLIGKRQPLWKKKKRKWRIVEGRHERKNDLSTGGGGGVVQRERSKDACAKRLQCATPFVRFQPHFQPPFFWGPFFLLLFLCEFFSHFFLSFFFFFGHSFDDRHVKRVIICASIIREISPSKRWGGVQKGGGLKTCKIRAPEERAVPEDSLRGISKINPKIRRRRCESGAGGCEKGRCKGDLWNSQSAEFKY